MPCLCFYIPMELKNSQTRCYLSKISLKYLYTNHNGSFLYNLMTADNGGGMTPDKMRRCMSLGYSAKSKMANTIGQCEMLYLM